MSWIEHHTQSEHKASNAELQERKARILYGEAAVEEELAFKDLDKTSLKTLGITAVSAVSLWLKAGQNQNAIRFGKIALEENLPYFARLEISEILRGLGD